MEGKTNRCSDLHWYSESKKQVPGVVRGRDDGEEAFRHPAISLYALIELFE